MPIASNFQSVYSHNWEINFLQCTPNGLLKHTELCNLLQLTAGYHAKLGGLSFTDMQKFHQAWVLSRMRIEIEELPKWRDIVTVKTWIIDLQGARSIRALEMYIGDKKVAGCSSYWVVFNTKLRRAEPLALPYSHYKMFPELMPTQSPFAKIDTSRETIVQSSRTVALSDLDIVYHANNVKYLEWCLDAVDHKKILNGQLKSFNMNYLRELKLADPVELRCTGNDDQTFFTINKAGKNCFALELNWK